MLEIKLHSQFLSTLPERDIYFSYSNDVKAKNYFNARIICDIRSGVKECYAKYAYNASMI